MTADHADVERRRDRSLRSKLALFGSGDQARLYALGGHRALIGRPASGLRPGSVRRLRAALDEPARYESVDPGAKSPPAEVSGRVPGGRGRTRALAIAVNGKIVATTRTLGAPGSEYFTALIPPASLRRGANRIELFAIS